MPEAVASFRERFEHPIWLAKYGGGDELADANCWNDAKAILGPLLDVAELANSLVVDLREHRYLSRKGAAVVADAFAGALRRLENEL